MIRILGAGGGTKGHAFPLKEILKSIKKVEPETFVLIAGVKDFEKEIAEELEGEFVKIELSGFPRRLSFRAIAVLLKALKESLRLAFISRKKGIDAVVVTGGYTSFPAALTAVLLRLPLYIHEQNAVFGLSNRIFARAARKVFLSLPLYKFQKSFKNLVLSGNPTREEAVANTSKSEALESLGLNPSTPTVLVFGGSQGAQTLNEAALKLIIWLNKEKGSGDIQIILLTGKKNYEEVIKKLESVFGKSIPESVKVFPEVTLMSNMYAAADLVVSRSGATTVAELIANGVPAILVPYPYATENHQYYNALYLTEKGSALMVKDEELKKMMPSDFYILIRKMLENEVAKKAAKELQENFIKLKPQDYIASEIFADLISQKKG